MDLIKNETSGMVKAGAPLAVKVGVCPPPAPGEDREIWELTDGLTEKQVIVLQQLSKTPGVTAAVTKAGVSRSTFYRWKANHAIFRSNYLELRRQMRQSLQSEMDSLAEDALLSLRMALQQGDDARLSFAVLKSLGLMKGEEE